MLIVNQQGAYPYIPVSERGVEEPFTVQIKPLGVREMAKLEDGYITIKENEGISLSQGAYNQKALKTGILSWENLKDEDGVEYFVKKSGKGEVLDESLNLLPPTILTEIANVIVSISKYPEDIDSLLGTVKEEEEVVKEEPKKPARAKK